jgi:hypothetical protein
LELARESLARLLAQWEETRRVEKHVARVVEELSKRHVALFARPKDRFQEDESFDASEQLIFGCFPEGVVTLTWFDECQNSRCWAPPFLFAGFRNEVIASIGAALRYLSRVIRVILCYLGRPTAFLHKIALRERVWCLLHGSHPPRESLRPADVLCGTWEGVFHSAVCVFS